MLAAGAEPNIKRSLPGSEILRTTDYVMIWYRWSDAVATGKNVPDIHLTPSHADTSLSMY